MAVSGVCSGVLEENSGKVLGKLLEKSSRIAKFRKRRTWAIAVRRGSCKSLFLPNSGRFSLEQ